VNRQEDEYDDADTHGLEVVQQRERETGRDPNRDANARSLSDRGIMNTPLSARALTRRLVTSEQLNNNIVSAANGIATQGVESNSEPSQLQNQSPSPTRGESFVVGAATRRALPSTLALSLFSDEHNTSAGAVYSISSKNSKPSPIQTGLSGRRIEPTKSNSGKDFDCDGEGESETLELAFCLGPAWSEPTVGTAILPGQGIPGERERERERERQEVLSQVSELDALDLVPIVAACQFALCINYARACLLHLLPLLQNQTALQTMLSTSSSVISGSILSPNKLVSTSRASEVVNFLSLSFRQLLQGRPVCERLFPSMSLYPKRVMTLSIAAADALSDVVASTTERVPCISPFMSQSVSIFFVALHGLERQLFSDSILSLSVEECGPVLLPQMELFISMIVDRCLLANQSFDRIESVDPASVSSFPKVGMFPTLPLPLSTSFLDVQAILKSLISSAVDTIEKASNSRFDSLDFIGLSLSPEKTLTADQELLSHAPPVLFAYWTLSQCFSAVLSALQKERQTQLSKQTQEFSNCSMLPVALSLLDKENIVQQLISSQTFGFLLRTSSTQNDSLRFLTHDLCSNLFRVCQSLLSTLTSALSLPRFECSTTTLSQIKDLILRMNKSFSLSNVREQRLMLSLSHRIKTERGLHSRYTRLLSSLLLHWNELAIDNKKLLKEFRERIRTHATVEAVLGHSILLEDMDSPDQQDRNKRRLWVEEFILSSLSPARSIVSSILRVTHTMSSSISLSWSIPSSLELNTGEVFSLYMSLHNTDFDNNEVSLCVPDIERDGAHVVDELDADTLYRFFIRTEKDISNSGQSENETSKWSNLCSLLIGTDIEPGFSFFSDSLSSNIQLSASSPLTLRNATSKKWSTAKASLRLCRGVHRWDVRIDRCVSKVNRIDSFQQR
jgi:hypothetical protein